MEKFVLELSSGDFMCYWEGYFPITYVSRDNLEYDILESKYDYGYIFLGIEFENYNIYTLDEWFNNKNLTK